MVIIHTYILGPTGLCERSYDFVQWDGEESISSKEVYVPYDNSYAYPMNEDTALHFVTVRPNVVPLATISD